MKLAAPQLRTLCSEAFARRGVSPMQTTATVDALILAEAQGLASHGISRVPMYLAHVAYGRVDPKAEPVVMRQTASAALVDAANGFAFPACDKAVALAIEKARDTGIAIGAVTNSHHFGVAGNHLLAMADAGMVGLAMGNSPAAMPAWGGKRAIFGTNPIAAIFPRQNSGPSWSICRSPRSPEARSWWRLKMAHRSPRVGPWMHRANRRPMPRPR